MMLTRLSLCISIIGLMIIPLQHVEAQAGPDIEIISTVSPLDINIGDTFYLEVLIRHSNAVAINTNLAMIPEIELVGNPVEGFDSLSDNSGITSVIYELQVFNFDLPQQLEVEVLWVTEDGQTGAVIDFVDLPTVIRLVTDASTTVRDLKPQHITAGDYDSVFSYRAFLATVLILLFLLALTFYFRRNKSAEILENTSEDIARSQLTELHSLELHEVADLEVLQWFIQNYSSISFEQV